MRPGYSCTNADQQRWDEACRREAALRGLLGQHPGLLSVEVVDNVARELGLSRATVYRLIRRYRSARTVSGLAPLHSDFDWLTVGGSSDGRVLGWFRYFEKLLEASSERA